MGDGPMTDVYEVYRIRVKPEIRRRIRVSMSLPATEGGGTR